MHNKLDQPAVMSILPMPISKMGEVGSHTLTRVFSKSPPKEFLLLSHACMTQNGALDKLSGEKHKVCSEISNDMPNLSSEKNSMLPVTLVKNNGDGKLVERLQRCTS